MNAGVQLVLENEPRNVPAGCRGAAEVIALVPLPEHRKYLGREEVKFKLLNNALFPGSFQNLL